VAVRVARLQEQALDALLSGVERKSAALAEILSAKESTMGEKTSAFHGSNTLDLAEALSHSDSTGGVWHRLSRAADADIHRQELAVTVVSTFHILEEMLSGSFPVVSNVPVELLILCCERALSLDSGFLLASLRSKAVVDTGAVATLLSHLPGVHNAALTLLQSLIERLRGNLTPHCDSLAGAVNVAFATSQSSGGSATDLQRAEVFTTAALAVTHLGPTVMTSIGAPALSHAIAELQSIGEAFAKFELVPLFSDNGGTTAKGGSKRARRKRALQQAMAGADENGALQAPHYSGVVAALSFTESLVRSLGTLLEEELRQRVDGLIASALLPCLCVGNVQTTSLLRVPEVRLGLYRALLACVCSVHPTAASVLSFAVPLFRYGARDTNSDVARVSKEALAIVDALLHPTRPITGEQLFAEEPSRKPNFIQAQATHSSVPAVTSAAAPSAVAPRHEPESTAAQTTAVTTAATAADSNSPIAAVPMETEELGEEEVPEAAPAERYIAPAPAPAPAPRPTVSPVRKVAVDTDAAVVPVLDDDDEDMGDVPDIVDEMPDSDLSDLSSGDDAF